MVVVWVNLKLLPGLRDRGAVAVIAAFLTFFPVAIKPLRGLHSADPRALELDALLRREHLVCAWNSPCAGLAPSISSPRSR